MNMSMVTFTLHTPTESRVLSHFTIPRIGEELLYGNQQYVVTNVIYDVERFQTAAGAVVCVEPK